MLGMTQEELCKDICGVKTLRRLEQNKTRAQMPVVSGLLARLGLPFEYQRMQIIADNYEAAVLFREVQTAANAYDTERVEKLLQRLVGLIPM